jgi:hypothetical protein
MPYNQTPLKLKIKFSQATLSPGLAGTQKNDHQRAPV